MSHLLEESIFGEALHSASIGAYLARNRDVLAVNQAICALTGYSRDELVGGLAHDIAADDDARRQCEEVRAGRRSSGSLRIVRKDGAVVAVSYVVSPTRVAREPLQLGLLWVD